MRVKMEYEVISKKPNQCLSLTSLEVEEFEFLLKHCTPPLGTVLPLPHPVLAIQVVYSISVWLGKTN
jgi:hypothetical protein